MLLFYHIGKYILLLRDVFSRHDNPKLLIRRIFMEMNVIGIESLGIILLISAFMGMVMTIEIAYQLVAPWISLTVVGSIVSDTSMLELSPTITALVLAGRVGSNISAEIGNMKISEQIDALEVMGVNSASYLIFPKIIASLISIPLLIIISIAMSIVGGLYAGHALNILSVSDYIEGAQVSFRTFTLVYAIIKAFTFSFIISSISSYQGYIVTGGALEVSKASTKAVVQSCIFILIFDYLLAALLL